MTTYQKVLNVYSMLRNWISAKMSKYDIANEFQTTKEYNEGDLVVHGDILYQCINHFAGGDWPADYSQWFKASTLDDAINYLINVGIDAASRDFVARNNIAGEFSKTESYQVGDVIFYGDGLYRCKSAHSAGEWNGNDFDEVQLVDIISGGVDLSIIAPEFVPSHQYSVGDLVAHDCELFMCKSPYSGAQWPTSNVSTYFEKKPVEAALELKASKSYVDDGLSSKADSSDIGYAMTYPGWVTDDPDFTVEVSDEPEEGAYWILVEISTGDRFGSATGDEDSTSLTFYYGADDASVHAHRTALLNRAVNRISVGSEDVFTMPPYVEGSARMLYAYIEDGYGNVESDGSTFSGENGISFVSDGGVFPTPMGNGSLYKFLEVAPHVVMVSCVYLSRYL